MAPRNILLVTGRVFRELRRDIRTTILFTASPTFVVVIISGLLHNYPQSFDRIGLIVIGLFPTAPAFLFTAFAMTRDRSRGTLEYLLTSPVSKLDILLGYVTAFTLMGLVQVAMTLSVAYGLLGLHTAGPWWAVGLLALVNGILGVAIGLFATNFAKDEFQLMKILAAVGVPHLMLSGLFRSPDEMVTWMRIMSDFAPWRYGVAAVAGFEYNASPTATTWFNLAVVGGIILLLFSVSSVTILKRRTA